MTALPIFDAFEEDVSTNGLGLIQPVTCIVEERCNGLYELTMEAPIDREGRFRLLKTGRLLRATVPACEIPLMTDGEVKDIYVVNRSSAKLYASPGGQKLRRLPYGTEAAVLGEAGDDHYHALVLADGATGYLRKRDVTFFRRAAVGASEVKRADTEQLFRIDQVEADTAAGLVTVKARHVFYDLSGLIAEGGYAIDAWTGGELALQDMYKNHLSAVPKHTLIMPEAFDCPVRLAAGGKSFVRIMLDEGGIMAQLGGAMVRDNFDIYILNDLERDSGVTIRRGKNLLSMVKTEDATGIVTEIHAYARDEKGNTVRFGGAYKSERIGDYPFAMTAERVYDLQVGTADTPTEADVMKAVEDAVAREFASGADRPKITLRVDALMQEGGGQAAIQRVRMFDTVRVIDELLGVDARMKVTGYRWDVVRGEYVWVEVMNN